MSEPFPKIIWQTHNHMVDELPDHLNKICGNWINLNPGWQHIYVDHIQRQAMVAELAPHLLHIYNNIAPMFQADIWRYLVTYEHGGVYADMDSACSKPLDQMLEEVYRPGDVDPEIIVVETGKRNGKSYTDYNANYIVKKKSYLMKQIIDSLVTDRKPDKRGMVYCNCGVYHQVPTELYNFQVHSTLINFEQILYDANPRDVSYSFTAADHNRKFKVEFEPYMVLLDYYYQYMTYEEFLINNNLKSMYY